MKEFFGIGGYTRAPEGFLSWQHITVTLVYLSLMIILAVILGLKNAKKSPKEQNRVLIAAALLIDGFELFKIGLLGYRGGDLLDAVLHNLPLFFCSIMLIALPLAAFTNGRIKEAAIDFVGIFGICAAIFGIIGAGQNYNAYPTLGFDNVVSGITHSISGFGSLYVLITGMAKMKKRNIGINVGILAIFSIMAYIANITIPYNYMFLMTPDGTPYTIFYNLVNGHPVFYPLIVIMLFVVYIVIFYGAYWLWAKKKTQKEEPVKEPEKQPIFK